MTPANMTRLQKAARELSELSRSAKHAQDVALEIIRVQELLNITLTDLVLRPEENDQGL